MRPLRCSDFSLRSLRFVLLISMLVAAAWVGTGSAQDGSAALSGVVEDVSGARIAAASVVLTDPSTGFRRVVKADGGGNFIFGMLAPGRYDVTASTTPDMAAETFYSVPLEVGGAVQLRFRLMPARRTETVTVTATAPVIDLESSAVSAVVSQQEIEHLPLNGRRFTDLALLTPGMVQDPRGLTSDSNGDLSVGGIRGYQNTFLVDGADNNNSFFAQARGRYRAPYQFSNEVIQEFRVSSNSYSAELGRTGGAVFNVVTKSGTNNWHGSTFYYLRDRSFDARPADTSSEPNDRQQQFGGSVGGPIRKDRIFLFAGYDQHFLTMPSIVQFANGASSVVPQPADYDSTDKALVFAAAQKLNDMGGSYPTTMNGNAAFGKVDFVISPRQLAFVRLNTSRFSGTNNVFFDPSSPITGYAESSNGSERVQTQSLAGSLTSAWTPKLATSFRAQYSRDAEESTANSEDPWTKIYNIMQGFGRSDILPRNTREQKLHLAETASYESHRIQWKFGGDFIQAWTYNYFPSMFGGEFYFDDIRVDPFTFQPSKYGEPLTPLQAYAHDVPRYYMQDFGTSVSHPDSRNYAAFVQSTIHLNHRLVLNAGVRYDLQTFEVPGLVSNPLYAPSGKVPTDSNNFSPRVGFAYAFGDKHPVKLQAAFGLFYTQIPSIYASQVATDNGVTQSELFLDNMIPADAAVFPKYPAQLANCPSGTTVCTPPASVAGMVTTQVSAFAPNFQTPYVEQANVGLEHEFGQHLLGSINYLHVHGVHLIRSLDANLPEPTTVDYPVYNDNSVFTGQYFPVQSFSTWQTTPSLSCPYPPCINPLQRPNPQLGTINSFESGSSSLYDGMTVSLKRQMHAGMYFQIGYTYAKAIDDGQDALVVGRPGNVQNSYATSLERGLSVNDQRNRFVASAVSEPRRMEFGNNLLDNLINHWKFSSVITYGSGRPINATMAGDPNQDDNTYNDRLPGFRRDAFVGPDYFTTDLRISRSIRFGERRQLDVMAESFNLFNRTNGRVNISDDGFYNSAGQFVAYSTSTLGNQYPGYFQLNSNFLLPTSAYAPRQVQLALRFKF